MMKMKLILLATLASLALGAIPLSRQSPDGDDYIPDDRAIGIFTTGNYWGEFTDGNKDLLEAYNLLDKKMVKDDDVNPTSETIEWTQTSKCFWGCSKEYLLVDYYQDGDKSNPVMKVYLPRSGGTHLRSSALLDTKAVCSSATSTLTTTRPSSSDPPQRLVPLPAQVQDQQLHLLLQRRSFLGRFSRWLCCGWLGCGGRHGVHRAGGRNCCLWRGGGRHQPVL